MNIVCIGSGAFGVAITSLLAKNEENKIFLWTHDEIFVKTVYKDEKLYITNKSIPLPDNVVVGTNLEEMIPESNVIFLLVSTSFIKDIAQKLQQFDLKNKRIFLGSKGVLEHTPFFYSKYLRQKLDVRDVDFFAGPNLAQDLIKNAFCSITFSSKNKVNQKEVTRLFCDDVILYFTKNTQALELASTLKNIYAIGSGMLLEKTLSKSSVHAYLAEAYYELLSILNILFFMDYHLIPIGITGDFYLTCTMEESRNFTFGRMIIKQEEQKYLKEHTVEGVQNLQNVYLFLTKKGVSAPLLETLYRIVLKKESVDALIETMSH